jgi:VanZ family protein
LCTIISIEFVQIYIPGRASDVRDVATNSFGAAVAVGLLYKVIHNLH